MGSETRFANTHRITLAKEMSKAKFDGEDRVRDYLTGVGLRVDRFSKAEIKGRTPDFRVFADGELAFYCEVKTAQEDEWMDRRLTA